MGALANEVRSALESAIETAGKKLEYAAMEARLKAEALDVTVPGRAVRQGRTLEEIYDLAKTKRYAHARIRRAVLWGALGLKERDRPCRPPYIRVLGAGARGREVLRKMKEKAALPVITKPAHGKGLPLFELEARCTDFYQLCRRNPGPCWLEWTTNPVMI